MSESIFAERNPLSRNVRELESQLVSKEIEIEIMRHRIKRVDIECCEYLNRLQEAHEEIRKLKEMKG